jgi:hypothetical protein
MSFLILALVRATTPEPVQRNAESNSENGALYPAMVHQGFLQPGLCDDHRALLNGFRTPIKGESTILAYSALGRIRTCDLRFRKPTLYPLSYEG